MSTPRLPTLFISHGAPTFALEPGTIGPLLTRTGEGLPRPRAVLVVSPHWMTPGLRVATTTAPRTIHDFGGFPRPLYALQYPAPGAPEVARRTADLLRGAGLQVEEDAEWGLDHGAWVPLRYLYPAADLPVFQLSLPADSDAASAYALGRALAPLRDEGVLIVASGSLTHNLYEFRSEGVPDAEYALEFAAWVRDAVESRDDARLVSTLEAAPHARRAHPTAEHFLPLLVAAGAAADEAAARTVPGDLRYGILSMDAFVFGEAQPATA